MIQKLVQRDKTNNFVTSMLKSAEETQETKPQSSSGNVTPNEIENVMEKIKKGMFRK